MEERRTRHQRFLPDGAELDRLRNDETKSKSDRTWQVIGDRYGVSRQAAQKAHAAWLRRRTVAATVTTDDSIEPPVDTGSA